MMTRPTLDLRRVAWHEAGHALVGHANFGNDGPVTIIPDDEFDGRQRTERFMWTVETLGQMLSGDRLTRECAKSQAGAAIRHSLAGRASESVLLGRLAHRFLDDSDVARALSYVGVAVGRVDAPGPLAEWLVLHYEWRRVRRWLKQHRWHLSRFANLLLRRRSLSAAEVADALLYVPPWLIPARSRNA